MAIKRIQVDSSAIEKSAEFRARVSNWDYYRKIQVRPDAIAIEIALKDCGGCRACKDRVLQVERILENEEFHEEYTDWFVLQLPMSQYVEPSAIYFVLPYDSAKPRDEIAVKQFLSEKLSLTISSAPQE